MNPLRIFAAVTIVVGFFMSSIGALSAAVALIYGEPRWYVAFSVGIAVTFAGVFLMAALTLLQKAIDEAKRSRAEAEGEPPDEFTAARIVAMWAEESDKVRDMLKDMGLEDFDGHE